MSEQEDKKEIRRMRTLLQKMAEMAEHVEQTGSFESGIGNSVKRYNNIVEHLEDRGAVPEDLFPRLEEAADAGQLGAEATLLADYLTDIVEEEADDTSGSKKNSESKKPDLNMMVALAPFLGSEDLQKILSKHFSGNTPSSEEQDVASGQSLDLKTILALAPHIDKATLGQMVRACFARQNAGDPRLTDPRLLVGLAPHMDKADLSQLIREYLPQWFGDPSPPPRPPEAPAPPSPSAPADATQWQEVVRPWLAEPTIVREEKREER